MKSHTIRIPIGDWSSDGHGQCDYYHFKSNKPVEDVREAFFAAKKKHPDIAPDTFCCDYEDHQVPENVSKSIAALGFDIDPDDGFAYDTEAFAKYVAWFCMLGDADLKLTKTPMPESLSFYGYDKKKRHIGSFGYGLLGN